jgi:hypothetical protein
MAIKRRAVSNQKVSPCTDSRFFFTFPSKYGTPVYLPCLLSTYLEGKQVNVKITLEQVMKTQRGGAEV